MKKALPPFLALAYLGMVQLLFGIQTEHGIIVTLLLALYYAHPRTRNFVIDVFPIVLFAVLYDLLRIYPKSLTGPIWVGPAYQLEKTLFGFSVSGVKIIPNEFFITDHHPFWDLYSALVYSLHMVVPLAFAIWNSWKNQRTVVRQFAWAFFWVNLLTFATWILLPVAPPWYVEQFGFTPGDWSTIGNAAGLLRVDQLTGITNYGQVYAKSAWVFGAVPSMHAGFPLMTILFAHKAKMRRALPFLYLFIVSVWFAAVYLRHHYVIDLLAGGLYVLIVFFLMRPITRDRLDEKNNS